MSKIGFIIAIASLGVGGFVLVYVYLNDRSILGMAFGALLVLNGFIRMYLQTAG